MQKTALRSAKREADNAAIPRADLELHLRGWLADCECRQLSKSTLETRRFVGEKLVWHIREQNAEECGISELRSFLAYAGQGHLDKEGRWGNPRMRRPVAPRTIHTYYGHLLTFYKWLVSEGVLDSFPEKRFRYPIARDNQIVPFTDEQIESFFNAARRSRNRRRDEAIIAFLYDTGLRATELCMLRMRNLDLDNNRCVVVGKGNKRRVVPFGKDAKRAISHYLKAVAYEPDAPVFCANRGISAGEPLTRSGLLQLVERLGEDAGICTARCSPHTFRHTFAINFLRNGGNVFTLKELLGHTRLDMTQRYVAIAQADIENQHRQFSPLDQMRRRRGK